MNEQIILAFIPYVVPSIIAFIIYVCHLVFKALPEKQRQALAHLELLALPAVQAVQQVYDKKSPEEKRGLAFDAIESGIQASGLPVPNEQIISTFLESAVFEMKRLKDAASANTAPIPQISQFKQQKENK